MSFLLLNPINDPGSWDIITLAGVDTPGLAEVGEPDRGYEWDVKVGKGAFGTTTTFTGRSPSSFSVRFKLWRNDHFVAWANLLPLLKYEPTKITYNFDTNWTSGINAIDIYHPSLADIDILSVVVKKIGAITHLGKGVYARTIEFLEWFPPPKLSAVATPAGSTPVDGLPPDPAIQALQQQIADLSAQAKAP